MWFKNYTTEGKPMTEIIHECQCATCHLDKERAEWKIHHYMNASLIHLDEQQRRWYVAPESKKTGHGCDVELLTITGMDVERFDAADENWMMIWLLAHPNMFAM